MPDNDADHDYDDPEDPAELPDWQPSSGAPIGVQQTDEAEVEQGVDHAKLNARDERWTRRYYDRCRFTDATLVNLSTSNCTFVGCDFTEADLGYSVHQRSIFADCLFRWTNLTSARFEECRLTGSEFGSATLANIEVQNSELGSVVLVDAELSGIDLRGCVLYGADLTRADLSNATLVDADLRNVTLQDTNFAGADLQGAHLEGFDALRANLQDARIDPEQAIELARAFGVVIG